MPTNTHRWTLRVDKEHPMFEIAGTVTRARLAFEAVAAALGLARVAKGRLDKATALAAAGSYGDPRTVRDMLDRIILLGDLVDALAAHLAGGQDDVEV